MSTASYVQHDHKESRWHEIEEEAEIVPFAPDVEEDRKPAIGIGRAFLLMVVLLASLLLIGIALWSMLTDPTGHVDRVVNPQPHSWLWMGYWADCLDWLR